MREQEWHRQPLEDALRRGDAGTAAQRPGGRVDERQPDCLAEGETQKTGGRYVCANFESFEGIGGKSRPHCSGQGIAHARPTHSPRVKNLKQCSYNSFDYEMQAHCITTTNWLECLYRQKNWLSEFEFTETIQ